MIDFCNDVTDWLVTGGDLSLAADVSGRRGETVARELIDRGVKWVLDVRSEWTDAKVWKQIDPSIQYCHAPIVDSHSHYVGEDWYRAVEDFVEDFWIESKDGDKLYVHCHMGVNRGPSAAMLALLTIAPDLDPYDAFLRLRDARPIAGLIYAEQVGRRHLRNKGEPVAEFNERMRDYWTQDRICEVNRGIAYYRTQEGGTIKVGGKSALACPRNEEHQVKWNSGSPTCLDCGALAVAVPA